MHVSCCSIVNAPCQRKTLLSAGISIFIFYTFQNAFAETLWHFLQGLKSVEVLVNLSTHILFQNNILLIFLATSTIFFSTKS